jgi:hypothetical protein
VETGLLWYDADRVKPTSRKIDEGVRRHREKFGRAPNACHVNPRNVVAHPALRVVADRLIQPNHFWLGDEEE